MAALDRILDRIARTMKLVAAVWLFLLSIFILIEVLARLANISLAGLKEVVANSIVVIAFLQLPYTVRIGGMLRAELIDDMVPGSVSLVLRRLAFLLGALLFGAVAYAGWTPMLRAWATGEYEGEGGFRVVTYPVRTAIVLCSALGALNFLMLALGVGPREAAESQPSH